MITLLALASCGQAFSQLSDSPSSIIPRVPAEFAIKSTVSLAEPDFVNTLAAFSDQSDKSSQAGSQQRQGFLIRNIKRGLNDQKRLYFAPFKRKNLKWDALFLLTTGALLATDRQASRQISTDHVNISHNIALLCIGSTGVSAGLIWLHGLRADDSHAKETGYLTLESLANTFLIYTPMQLLAARERPDDGTGNGRFWQHHSVNTSFPAGHPMFTWAMASVIAHEYPKTWVKFVTYGAALAVSVTRFTGRNHFPSDIFVGSTLGYLIGTNIYHAHCNPDFSDACHR
jgi:membrane-associated phospholipid phosphatase